MSDFNSLIVTGRLTRDPLVRQGGNCAVLPLAINRQYRKGDEWIEEAPVYLDVAVFGPAAARCIETMSKADTVIVEGRLVANVEQTDQGEKRRDNRVIADTAKLLSKYQPKAQPTAGTEQTEAVAEPEFVPAAAAADDDIPF